ncbi:hypothetical protein [Salinibacterium sp. ZJ77]|uniref:hypothetical protein n=1 Tax=Salinibacterium sp. ZJ77 TaxID=2708337 RepID=UPI00141FB215|nr:hypothetical protein [Salinibacterium sp. ZJ77]
MTARDHDDIRTPQDHLPPASERGEDEVPEQIHYPSARPTEEGGVSPATAAEPHKPEPHGLGGAISGPR